MDEVDDRVFVFFKETSLLLLWERSNGEGEELNIVLLVIFVQKFEHCTYAYIGDASENERIIHHLTPSAIIQIMASLYSIIRQRYTNANLGFIVDFSLKKKETKKKAL